MRKLRKWEGEMKGVREQGSKKVMERKKRIMDREREGEGK